MRDVLILGGYGNFGKRIATALNRLGVPVILAGRNLAKAQTLAANLPLARATVVDIHRDLKACLLRETPSVVVHTSGPFQGADYAVARACIQARCHYVDLADARDFVRDFGELDAQARAAGVTAISGASTVPGLASAVIGHFRPYFAKLDRVDFGISPGQRAERGLATTRGILSYAGKRLRPFAGHNQAYGWMDNRSQVYPGLGRRWFANCDIPDLDLLPAAYGLGDIRFGAGMELPLLHFGLYALAGLVRLGLPLDLPRLAAPLLAASNLFDFFGSDAGGMHMILSGTGPDGQPLSKTWFIVADHGDGPQIPTVPAILLAKRLHEKDPSLGAKALSAGAYPCVGLVSLEAYLEALAPFSVKTY